MEVNSTQSVQKNNNHSVSEKDLKIAIDQSQKLIDDDHQIDFLKNNAPWGENRPFKPINIYKDQYDISNKTIFGVQPMTRLETKLLRIVLASAGDQTEKPFRITISDLTKVLNLSLNSSYNQLYKTAWALSKRQLFLEDENGWAAYNWISNVRYNKGEIIIKLNDDLKDFLPNYNEGHYTKLSLPIILTFTRKHSIHIYEGILSKIRKNYQTDSYDFDHGNIVTVSFSVKELRSLTASLYIYKSIADFKRRVINPSIEEISELSDISILKYTSDKIASSKINVFTFYVQKKKNFSAPSFDNTNLIENIEAIELIPDDEFSGEYIIKTFEANHCRYTTDNIDYLVQKHTKDSFIKDFKKAKPLAKSDITNYMVSILENRELNDHPLTNEEEKQFDEIVNYWNDYSAERMASGLLYCSPILRKSKKMQRSFKDLLKHGITISEIKKAIEIANDSPYFCRVFNNFSYFLIYKNFVGIQSGNYKVDSNDFAYINAMTQF